MFNDVQGQKPEEELQEKTSIIMTTLPTPFGWEQEQHHCRLHSFRRRRRRQQRAVGCVRRVNKFFSMEIYFQGQKDIAFVHNGTTTNKRRDQCHLPNQPTNRPFVHPIIRLTTHCSWTNSHLTHLEISGCKKTAENTRFVCVPRKEGKACHERHHSTSKVSVYSHRDGEDVAPSNGKATVKLTTITTATETARPTWLGSAGKVR